MRNAKLQTLLFVLVGLLLTALPANGETPLDEYIALPDAAYKFELVGEQRVGPHKLLTVKLTSQNWRGNDWEHWLAIIVPGKIRHPSRAVLVIGGGSSRNLDSFPELRGDTQQFINMLANSTGAPIAFVTNVPHQPSFGDKYEDALIAHTFDRYLETSDETWPALLPMTKAAIRAMDTVQTVLSDQGHDAPGKFIVTGASKRGWTTYLTAATDPRVLAIMPMVFDVLNMPEQMPHQQKSLGSLRDKIDDYTKLDIPARLVTPAGKALVSMVDPFSYRDRLSMPKLIVLGTNDPYWSTDASSLYLDQLSGPTMMYYAPNKGHRLGTSVAPVLLSFVQAMLDGRELPSVTWSIDKPGQLSVQCDAPNIIAMQWSATSPTRDFNKANWSSKMLKGDNSWQVKTDAPTSGYVATYIELIIPQKTGTPMRTCTPITITPDTYPK